ncbi:MAG: MoaD/ThiS family protein [Coriobacteriia bacterium]|nr:MoaD/ThiS family protein [Coriobacteriia bacterium]
MQTTQSVTVRTIAFLDAFRRQRGLPSTLDVEVPEAGTKALDLAASLELPLDRIEGVFLNYSVSGLDALVMPGDRVVFVPYGTPASHPAFFGPFITRR